LIELNPRLWQQNAHATASGINFPLIQYRDLTGPPPAPRVAFKSGVRWLDAVADFQAFWAYRQAGELSAREWLASLRGTRSFATFAFDDPGPYLKANRWGLKYLRAPVYALRQRR
jgi:predicted ATP-grasp superfamily ATP-dependent carboligase